ncbi:MAG: hypothetical protein NDI60_08805 [Elusimicrobiales bacterium]|nr:hypothetical protein [Elusimicrobiales bacterium]
MNTKLLITMLAALLLGAARASAKGGMAGHKEHTAAAIEHTDCLEQWEGVKAEKEVLKNGVEFTLTAETPAAVKELREKAAAHLKTKDCPLFKDAGEIGIENIENGIKVTAKAGKQAAAGKQQVAAKKKHGCACCGGGEEKTEAKASTAAYACPMGCAESDKPGKCPKCGMNLVENKKAAQAKKD